MRIVWEGIPKKYWPDTRRPWRVAWGIGCFLDFETREAAQAKADRLRQELEGDWADTVEDPFNATEI